MTRARVGIAFGAILAVIGVFMSFSANEFRRFTCARDDAGKGSCVYLERRPFGEKTTRWSVESLRGARVDGTGRLVVLFEGSERGLFDHVGRGIAEARAHDIADFVANAGRRTLFVEENEGPQLLGGLVALAGVAIVVVAYVLFRRNQRGRAA